MGIPFLTNGGYNVYSTTSKWRAGGSGAIKEESHLIWGGGAKRGTSSQGKEIDWVRNRAGISIGKTGRWECEGMTMGMGIGGDGNLVSARRDLKRDRRDFLATMVEEKGDERKVRRTVWRRAII